MTPSVGIIIYQARLKIHRPLWCWLGWRVDRLPRPEDGVRPVSTGKRLRGAVGLGAEDLGD